MIICCNSYVIVRPYSSFLWNFRVLKKSRVTCDNKLKTDRIFFKYKISRLWIGALKKIKWNYTSKNTTM